MVAIDNVVVVAVPAPQRVCDSYVPLRLRVCSVHMLRIIFLALRSETFPVTPEAKCVTVLYQRPPPRHPFSIFEIDVCKYFHLHLDYLNVHCSKNKNTNKKQTARQHFNENYLMA